MGGADMIPVVDEAAACEISTTPDKVDNNGQGKDQEQQRR
jgi:hypothetical protein